MCAVFDDMPVEKYCNLISKLNSGQAVGDQYGALVGYKIIELRVDLIFG